MRILALSLMALVALAACGGQNDHKALVASCTAGGESPAACSCIADAMQARLSPDLYKRTAQAIGREKRDVEAYIVSLPTNEQLEFAGVVNDLFTCKLAPPKE